LHHTGDDIVALSVADDGAPLPANLSRVLYGFGLDLIARPTTARRANVGGIPSDLL